MINNNFTLVGRVAREPEIKTSASGVTSARTAIAVYQGKDAQGNTLTDFFNIVAFNKTANSMERFLKGDQVAVTGRLKINKWVDQQTGQNRNSTDLIVDAVMLIAHSQNTEVQQRRVPEGYEAAPFDNQYASIRNKANDTATPYDANNWSNPLNLDDDELPW